MSRRTRLWVFAAVVVAAVAGSAAYLVFARSDAERPARAVHADALRRATSGPFIAFLSAPPGGDTQDRLMVARLDDLSRRVFTGLLCDRVGVSRAGGICIRNTYSAAFGYGYRATFFDRAFHVTARPVEAGIPSRSRTSPDGRLAAATSFTVGDSYLSPGAFSTVTTIFDRATGRRIAKSLNDLTALRNGQRFAPVDRNFWGVTFRDDRTFYATMATHHKTYLVRGDLTARTMTLLRENVECPSLSPDGRLIAFKKRVKPRTWRFTVLDLATGVETPLAEKRNIDDQQAWFDDRQVLHNIEGSVWVEPADGSGRPRILLRNAASPTVVS